jgi:hypothetical protein
MKVRILPVWIGILAAVTAAHGVQKDYATGKVLEVQERTRDRVLLYQVNTPIMTEDPSFTVSVEVNGTVYDAEYLPHSPRELFPEFWKPEENALVRIDKHFMFLKRRDGTEAKFLITRKSRPHSVRESH